MTKVLRLPITRAVMLDSISTEGLVAGYMDGLKNKPEPTDQHSYSYWHGWRNGMVDGGHRKIDEYQQALAHDVKVQKRVADAMAINPKGTK